jgi:hypothetical protein
VLSGKFNLKTFFSSPLTQHYVSQGKNKITLTTSNKEFSAAFGGKKK